MLIRGGSPRLPPQEGTNVGADIVFKCLSPAHDLPGDLPLEHGHQSILTAPKDPELGEGESTLDDQPVLKAVQLTMSRAVG